MQQCGGSNSPFRLCLDSYEFGRVDSRDRFVFSVSVIASFLLLGLFLDNLHIFKHLQTDVSERKTDLFDWINIRFNGPHGANTELIRDHLAFIFVFLGVPLNMTVLILMFSVATIDMGALTTWMLWHVMSAALWIPLIIDFGRVYLGTFT